MIKARVLSDFVSALERNILHSKEAYLLVGLLADLHSLSSERGMAVPAIAKTCELRNL